METRIDEERQDFTLDGNALAGLFFEIFNVEMTVAPVECGSCGRHGEMGSLLAFPAGPGYVLRCPSCQNIILRMVITPDRIYMDARGAAYLCIPKSKA